MEGQRDVLQNKDFPAGKDSSRMSSKGHYCEGSCHSLYRSSMKQESESTVHGDSDTELVVP